MRRIASRQNPIVARYRAAARGDSADAGILLDGAHLVTDALHAGLRLREAAVAAEPDAPTRSVADELQRAGVDTVAVTLPVLSALSPVRAPSGVVAIADRPGPRGDGFSGASPLVVVAVDVQDPGNLGAIVRVAEAGGASGVIVAGASADPYGWKALRGSMGSALRLPIVVSRTSDLLADLRDRGLRIVATAPRGGRPLSAVDFNGAVAILIGGEGPGLSAAHIAGADERVSIPMQARVESLNAAVTAALLVYEARRQRRTAPEPAGAGTP